MNPLTKVWSTLDLRRRVIVVGATLVMFAAVLGLSRMATAPSMSLLYSGLESAAAGDVIQALEQQGVSYDIRGGAIYVDSARRDQLRLTLASQGLPATGGAGYELLDSLSGFGTTSQMFDAAYWRAKEGELARTILANPAIKSARVHIAASSRQPFRTPVQPSASVTVTTANGKLTPTHAKALRHLIASSVAGLEASAVSVIDGAGGLIAAEDDNLAGGPAADGLSERLRQNVSRLLTARMGPGRSVVEVSIEKVTERETIVEHLFDPEGRVAISTETEENSSSSKESGQGGGVTVASNLPEGDAASDRNSSSTNATTRQRTNFEVSETTRELHRTPGAVKRLSVAVLLDGTRRIDDTGKEVWEPLPQEELSALRELVASAVGFDEARGDVITLKSMPFDPLPELGTAAQPGLIEQLGLNVMSLIQLAVLGLVGLLLGLFVVRPILANPGSATDPVTPDLPAILPAPVADAPAELSAPTLSEGEVIEPLAELPAGTALAQIEPPEGSADPVERLRQLIQERQQETVEILRSWMEEEEHS